MSNKTTSKIPKFKNGSSLPRQSRQKPDSKTQNDSASSYMQLHITKVYFLKKGQRKSADGKENFDGSVTELANKISTICNKIKDVESCMFLGKKLTNTQLEFLPTEKVNVVKKSPTTRRLNNPDRKTQKLLCDMETKRYKNCFNVNNSSSLFSHSEFSFQKHEKSVQTKSKFDFFVNETTKWPLKFILGELSQRTEEIMKKMSDIDFQIKEMNLVVQKDVPKEPKTEGHGNCHCCKSVYEILCDQKRQISNIAQTLTECVSKFPDSFQNQKNIKILLTNCDTIYKDEQPEMYPFKDFFLDEIYRNSNITDQMLPNINFDTDFDLPQETSSQSSQTKLNNPFYQSNQKTLKSGNDSFQNGLQKPQEEEFINEEMFDNFAGTFIKFPMRYESSFLESPESCFGPSPSNVPETKMEDKSQSNIQPPVKRCLKSNSEKSATIKRANIQSTISENSKLPFSKSSTQNGHLSQKSNPKSLSSLKENGSNIKQKSKNTLARESSNLIAGGSKTDALSRPHLSSKSCQYSQQVVNKSTKISENHFQNGASAQTNLNIDHLLTNLEELMKNEKLCKDKLKNNDIDLFTWKNKNLNSSSCTSDTAVTEKIYDNSKFSKSSQNTKDNLGRNNEPKFWSKAKIEKPNCTFLTRIRTKSKFYRGAKNYLLYKMISSRRKQFLDCNTQNNVETNCDQVNGPTKNAVLEKQARLDKETRPCISIVDTKVEKPKTMNAMLEEPTKLEENAENQPSVEDAKVENPKSMGAILEKPPKSKEENLSNISFEVVVENGPCASEKPKAMNASLEKQRNFKEEKRSSVSIADTSEKQNGTGEDTMAEKQRKVDTFLEKQTNLDEGTCLALKGLNFNEITIPDSQNVEPEFVKQDVRKIRNKYYFNNNSVNKSSPFLDDGNLEDKLKNKFLLCVGDSKDIEKLKTMGLKPVPVTKMPNSNNIENKNEINFCSRTNLNIFLTLECIKSFGDHEEVLDLGLPNVSDNSFCIEPADNELNQMVDDVLYQRLLQEESSKSLLSFELKKIKSVLKRKIKQVFSVDKMVSLLHI